MFCGSSEHLQTGVLLHDAGRKERNAIGEKHDMFAFHDVDAWTDEEEICTTAC